VIRFAFTIAFAVIAGGADAQSVKLGTSDMSALLTGNTAVGLWDGVPYRQYFGPDGVTIFAPLDAKPEHGQWRLQNDEFQSKWPDDEDWEGWYIMEYAGVWHWVSKSTPPTQFEMLEGNHLPSQ
jgi:hypothetical protein